MFLLGIRFPHHAAVASRAAVAVDLIRVRPHRTIARIQRNGRVFAEQPFALPDVKPNTLAVLATIDLDAFVHNGFHTAFAFRTNHGTKNTPLDVVQFQDA